MSRPGLVVRLRLPLDRFELDVDLEATAQVTGVFGPSGAGKSSLLRAIAGLERRARGEIRLGREVWLASERRIDLAPERRGVGYVPQDGLLFPHRNVRGNLLAGADRARRAGHDAGALLATVCRLLELEPLLERAVDSLSGGERQRVALGRAICSGPRLLLLDEPLASLDLPLRRRVLPFLRRLREELEVPMVLVSHDPTEIQSLCDEVAALREGRIVATGAPRRVLTDPRVFPLTEGDGLENVLAGVVTATGDDFSEVSLTTTGAGVRLIVPRAGPPGTRVLLGLSSHEILLATREPVGLSARNVVPATVAGVEAIETRHLVTAVIDAGVPEVAVEVTARAARDLELAAGRRVFLVFKARSCVVYGSREHGSQG